MRFDRLGDGERDARERRDMKHAIDTLECGPDGLAVADVGLDQIGVRIQVPAATGGKNIDDAHLEAARKEFIDQVRADKPGAPGNQYRTGRAHAGQLWWRGWLNCEGCRTGLNSRVPLSGFPADFRGI